MSLTVEQRLDRLESRHEIDALVAGYCEGVDRKDLAKFSSLWHPDADYLIGAGRGDFHGIAEITTFPDVAARAWTGTQHWTTNHVVTFADDDHATGRSDCIAIGSTHQGGHCWINATYVDAYERRDGVWKFARRQVLRWWVSSPVEMELAPPG